MRKVYDFTENVLIVLYILQKAGLGLTLEQINAIFLNTTELNYIDAALALEHLKEQELLSQHETPTGVYFLPTIEGRRVLGHFITSIRSRIRENIDQYITENKEKLQLAAELKSDYVPVGDGSYLVVLRTYEKAKLLSEIALFAVDAAEAHMLAENWTERAGEVHSAVYKILSREK